jgi:putative ubiquitin-RnfH superfamily antitoxin RatB of RatAB toxin-antitoxin module|tara:strand:- start:284 stop:565 length:282 start_codon:yes stop_codon:yes gene_type:complete
MIKNYIEIIYISSNNKIIKSKVEFRDNLTLNSLKPILVKNSIFSENFFIDKSFGCFGKRIDTNYVIKVEDRIEILDNLKMSPNDKRKFKFEKN